MVCPLPSRKRRILLPIIGERCGWKCVYCEHPLVQGAANRDDRPTLDHATPRSQRGGPGNLPRNFVLACHPCNTAKGNTDLATWLESRSLPPDHLNKYLYRPERRSA